MPIRTETLRDITIARWTRLRDVVDAIDAARDDERISSLYLDLGGLEGGGTAKLQEVAGAIDAFRATGKPVIAFDRSSKGAQAYSALAREILERVVQ